MVTLTKQNKQIEIRQKNLLPLKPFSHDVILLTHASRIPNVYHLYWIHDKTTFNVISSQYRGRCDLYT